MPLLDSKRSYARTIAIGGESCPYSQYLSVERYIVWMPNLFFIVQELASLDHLGKDFAPFRRLGGQGEERLGIALVLLHTID